MNPIELATLDSLEQHLDPTVASDFGFNPVVLNSKKMCSMLQSHDNAYMSYQDGDELRDEIR